MVSDNVQFGVSVTAGSAVLEGVLVSDASFDADETAGGLVVATFADSPARAQLTVTGSHFARDTGTGLLVADADATIGNVAVVDTAPLANGYHGHGVHIQSTEEGGVEANATLTDLLVTRSSEGGVVFSGLVRGADNSVALAVSRAPDRGVSSRSCARQGECPRPTSSKSGHRHGCSRAGADQSRSSTTTGA